MVTHSVQQQLELYHCSPISCNYSYQLFTTHRKRHSLNQLNTIYVYILKRTCLKRTRLNDLAKKSSMSCCSNNLLLNKFWFQNYIRPKIDGTMWIYCVLKYYEFINIVLSSFQSTGAYFLYLKYKNKNVYTVLLYTKSMTWFYGLTG